MEYELRIYSLCAKFTLYRFVGVYDHSKMWQNLGVLLSLMKISDVQFLLKFLPLKALLYYNHMRSGLQ